MELKLEQQFKKGALEMVLLSLIARQRSYGYELISRLQREGGGLFQETKGRYSLSHFIPAGG